MLRIVEKISVACQGYLSPADEMDPHYMRTHFDFEQYELLVSKTSMAVARLITYTITCNLPPKKPIMISITVIKRTYSMRVGLLIKALCYTHPSV